MNSYDKEDNNQYERKAMEGSVNVSPRMILWFLLTLSICLYALSTVELDKFAPNVLINFGLDLASMLVGMVILICYTIDRMHSGEDTTLFKMIIAIDFTELGIDILAWILEGNSSYKVPNLLINTTYYILGYVLVFLFWKYILDYLKEKSKLVHTVNIILNIGLIISCLVMLLNMKFKFIFEITPNSIYERMPLHPLSHIYAYVVMIATLIVIIENRKKFYVQQFVTFIIYILIPATASIASLFIYGISLLYPTIMIVILLMFSMINVAKSRSVAMVVHDMATAASIQADALPKDFDTISEGGQFDIFAFMKPAQNVGGDFYDFFMVDEDHLAVVMADVSGKGMSAALFMMEAKILIRSTALVDVISPSKVFEQVNKQLCDSNKELLFVTAWLGILTVSTGQLIYSNAGHENPMLCRRGSGFNPRREKHSPPLAIDPDTEYFDELINLNKGDMVFVYTDGVTDAKDIDAIMFGEKKLNEVLNKATNISVQEVIRNVNDAIEGFTNSVPQFDDITMLCFKYNGSKNIERYQDDKITSLKVEAKQDNLPNVIDFLNGIMEREGASKSVINKVDVAVDELFVNIARYAYGEGTGLAVIETRLEPNPRAIVITFIDEGVKYNPLKKKDPDVTLTSDLRDIGGLGIYIVKKTMDFVYYEHKGGNNIFTIKKYLDEDE